MKGHNRQVREKDVEQLEYVTEQQLRVERVLTQIQADQKTMVNLNRDSLQGGLLLQKYTAHVGECVEGTTFTLQISLL